MNTSSGKVEVTAHNHGFAVKLEQDSADSPAGFGRVVVSHRGLNDQVVEGLECLDIPAFSVQYHPEAAAGPHDSHYLFDKFLNAIKESK
jgi:carbamoyl-phosphate synthase small subunit